MFNHRVTISDQLAFRKVGVGGNWSLPLVFEDRIRGVKHHYGNQVPYEAMLQKVRR